MFGGTWVRPSDGAAFVREVERLVRVGKLPPNLRVDMRRPFPDADKPWLLRSLLFLRLEMP